MPRDVRAYLWDMQAAAAEIERFIQGLDSEAFARSEMVSAAVERKFEIIGEALAQLSKAHPDVTTRIPDARAIVSFRNLLIHGYAAIDRARVLAIARSSLPALVRATEDLLRDLGPP